MARATIDKATVERYVRMGLTQEQMRHQFYEETGERRSRAAFSVWIHRTGIENPRALPRYDWPWTIPREHHAHYDLRMLRALRARERGKPNKDDSNGRLDAWLDTMNELDAVVHYDSELGFFRVPREPGDVGYIRRPDETEG